MKLSVFDKANRSQQNLPQGKQTLNRLVNNTHHVKPNKFLTEISVSEASHCSLIDFTMHSTDGSKKVATSELRKDIVHPIGRDNWRHTQEVSTGQSECWAWDHYRECFQTWYRGSSAFLNLSFVILSKRLTMWGISSEKRVCPSKPSDHALKAQR